MLQLQRCIHDYRAVPGAPIVNRALEELQLHAPIFRYLVHCYGHYGDYDKVSKTHLATLPSTFLASVLGVVLNRVDHKRKRMHKDWCEFHEHKTAQEREECEDERGEDPDVISEGFEGVRRVNLRFGSCY